MMGTHILYCSERENVYENTKIVDLSGGCPKIIQQIEKLANMESTNDEDQ